ncbi:hypothetical protein O3G_MSEX003864 [Manduca sexta]|uniref:Uncharacterized protein n=1 Tax=Manduca sexta TaxID=7130 RepID=A0A921YTG6_MANSE|nr:hypothetical protein O3G_MSEX003864 [Manduca sexta]KAG6445319.1 hypothetical protein O3G_MSEX003864 [Manduca sexta]
MSETYREQYPLLCDDLSDEERHSPHYQRQYRHMKYKGRARSNVKGAVAILKRWPDHWSSFLTYWWIGVVMICLMTFVLYNSLFAFSVLPTAHFKPMRSHVPSLNTVPFITQGNKFPNVFIHVFTNDDKEIDLKEHLSRVETLANKYLPFNYHLVVVVNDTTMDRPEFNPEENNANALNSLWGKNVITKSEETTATNIIIEYISLTKYMDNSPVSKYWRTLSKEIIEFLIRALSIWDKGGITFDPIILTPQTPSPNYYKKLENIFKTFSHSETVKSPHTQSQNSKNVSHHKLKQKVNNIRDIINALEHENNLDFSSDEILSEVESKNVAFITKDVQSTVNKITRNNKSKSVSKRDMNTRLSNNKSSFQEDNKTIQVVSGKNDTSTLTMLPLFLEYFYHNNSVPNKDKDSMENNTKDVLNQIVLNKNHLKTNDIKENKDNNIPTGKNILAADEKRIEPLIIPVNEVNDDIKETKNDRTLQYPSKNDNGDQHLTIDIKGNLLATETACHAFLGTIFIDASHYRYDDKLSDFIVKELSIFCNGVLSSCSGIELILL